MENLTLKSIYGEKINECKKSNEDYKKTLRYRIDENVKDFLSCIQKKVEVFAETLWCNYKFSWEIEKYFSVSVYFLQAEDEWKVYSNVPDKSMNELYNAPDFTYSSLMGYSIVEEFKRIVVNSKDIIKDVVRITNEENKIIFRYSCTMEENQKYQDYNKEFNGWIESEEGKLYKKIKGIVDSVERNLADQIDHKLLNFTEKDGGFNDSFYLDISFFETEDKSIAIWDYEICKEGELIFSSFNAFREFVIVLNEFSQMRQIDFCADIIKSVLHFSVSF